MEDDEGNPPELADRLNEIRARGNLSREFEVGAINVEDRTVELSFSSETESVERWFGIEILGHGPGEVDLSRLNSGAPLLWMHNAHDQRGVVESARIDSDRVGRAVVRFSKSPEGEQLFRDVQDKIITKVSVGYSVRGLKLIEERDDTPVYYISDWQPNEISMVSVPADDTVGVGRAMENPPVEMPAEPDNNSGAGITPQARNESQMDKILRDGSGNLVRATVNEAGEIVAILQVIEEAGADVRNARSAGAEAERARVRALVEMGNQYGRADLAATHLTEGRTVEELSRAILADFAQERSNAQPLGDQVEGANIGMSDREVRSYSIMRAVRALVRPDDKKAREAAAFEIECSRAAEAQYGRESRGILIPTDVLSSSRAFNAGGAANTPTGAVTGSNLVQTHLLTGSFIDMLRNRTTIMQLGSTMGGLVGNVDIPKQTGGATAYWLGEHEDATEGSPTIGQIGLTPKTVAAYTDISRRLMMQSTPDAEGIVVRDLNAAMAQAIDRAGYYGLGSDDQPLGLANYSGINAVDFAAANSPTFAELVQMETEIAADNADIGSMAYVGNARFRGYAKTTPKFASGASVAAAGTIWEPGGTVNGYRTEITNQIDTGDVFFGNFADLIIALWGGLDLMVDPYSLSKNGGTRIVIFQDVDFVLRRAESICLGRAV